MCRLRQFRYLACGHNGEFKHATDCANKPDCITTEIPQYVDRFCNACMLSPELERRREDHNYIISDHEREAAGLIFTWMAAEPGKRYVNYIAVGRGQVFKYDAEDVHRFNERVTRADGLVLKRIEYVMNALIWEMLLDADADTDPIQNEIRLYLQTREAALVHVIHEDEDRRSGIEPPDHHQEIIRRLRAILTDVPIPDDNECSFCLEEYGPEMPAQLPCSHIFGRACLETWVAAFVPGSGEFVVCTWCRDGFGLLTGWEAAAGIGAPQGEMPLWMEMFRTVWPHEN